MAKTFKSWDVDQMVLRPPSVHELVPAGHLAHFVRDLVRDSLNLSAILKTDTEDRGCPPYDPVMMTVLLRYAYCQGRYASRGIARACEERVDVKAVTARQTPRRSHGQRLPEAPSDGAGRAVHAGASAVPESGVGAVGVQGPRRHDAQGQRLAAKGDERWPQAEDRSGPGRNGARGVGAGGDSRRPRGCGVGPGASRGRIADVGRRQAGAAGEDPAGQGCLGSRGPSECGGCAPGRPTSCPSVRSPRTKRPNAMLRIPRAGS